MTLKTQKSQPGKENNTESKQKQEKAFCLDQNAINLSKQELTDAKKSLLRKGPSFISNPTDINWFHLKRDFDDNFVNKFHYMATKQNDENEKNADPQLDSRTSGLGNPLPIQKQRYINYQKEKTNINSLETFIELVENDIFKPDNYKRIKNNISNQERKALKDMQKYTSKPCCIQDKGSHFAVFDSDSYIEKIDCQFERSSFQQLDYNPSDKFCKKVTS